MLTDKQIKILYVMKKKLLTIVFAMIVASASADNYSYLTFKKSDGTMISVGTESLTMTFSDGKLVADNGSSNISLTLTELASMFFSNGDDATGIDNIPTDTADGKIEAFSTQGISYGTFDSVESLKKSLPGGVYIIKQGGKTFKVAVK